MLLYGLEAWLLLSTAALRVFERKVLRNILKPRRVGDDFRIRFNSELNELLNAIDVVQRINIQRLRWLGHVVRMEEDAPARQLFDAGGYLRKSAKSMTLHPLERSNQGSPVIDWCNQLV